MSNYHVQPVDKPQALTTEAIKSLRNHPVQGISRRRLLRVSLGGGVALWLTELAGGTLHFLWPNLEGGFGDPHFRIGTLDEIKLKNSTLPVASGFPAYIPDARAFIVLIDPARQSFVPGTDEEGDGTALNVRALYQRCPHLGCKPNPCLKNYWLECPCHGSRYDRLGVKAAGTAYGPAPRGMDRFSATVEADGTLYLNTSKITLGPLPVAVGQPGIIPPKSPTGCI
ncbi:MAG TPA: Rieske 2Fe-2S domain-containing protein [Candidatus Limnocylindrales bacterium]|nr:Rieske 2Fe-2S domain-containing protein [Candidatus Limnocylindrales bacterium]